MSVCVVSVCVCVYISVWEHAWVYMRSPLQPRVISLVGQSLWYSCSLMLASTLAFHKLRRECAVRQRGNMIGSDSCLKRLLRSDHAVHEQGMVQAVHTDLFSYTCGDWFSQRLYEAAESREAACTAVHCTSDVQQLHAPIAPLCSFDPERPSYTTGLAGLLSCPPTFRGSIDRHSHAHTNAHTH